MPEILAGVEGAIVPVESPDPLASAIADRLLDRERAEAEGRANRRLVEGFDLRRTTEEFADAYRELIDGQR